MKYHHVSILAVTVFLLASCGEGGSVPPRQQFAKGTFGFDSEFLSDHLNNTIELSDSSGSARILVSGDYQGRVMTSTASGDSGNSYGWINYDLISSKKILGNFNPVGGEERLWLGPEGGQFSLYFKPGDSMNIAAWQVPAIIDTVAYKVIETTQSSATFSATAALRNYSGSNFKFNIVRKVSLIPRKLVENRLSTKFDSTLKVVAYETDNRLTNTGDSQWTKKTGLISIWLLGMLTPGDSAAVVVPFAGRKAAASLVSDDYFGKVPAERLKFSDSVLFLQCDGKHRSKIGLPPQIAKPIAVSVDLQKNLLTFIVFEIDKGGAYVNSKWEMQKDPYSGDVLNAYNDGPLADGSQLGPFYELESSSAARELSPGETQQYRQITCHVEGNREQLSDLLVTLTGAAIDSIPFFNRTNK